jgi:hypothetical protein
MDDDVARSADKKPRRVDGHQAACALLARRWVTEGQIPAASEGYAAALLASKADLALREVIAVCRGERVPGYVLPDELAGR